jgi:hypothetical protein
MGFPERRAMFLVGEGFKHDSLDRRESLADGPLERMTNEKWLTSAKTAVLSAPFRFHP